MTIYLSAGQEEVTKYMTWDKTFTDPAMNRNVKFKRGPDGQYFIDSTPSTKMDVMKTCREN
jgi:hypothetical protein